MFLPSSTKPWGGLAFFLQPTPDWRGAGVPAPLSVADGIGP